jgi:hypothetical protein
MKRHPLHRRTRGILASVSKELSSEIPWAECFPEIVELDEAVRKCFEPAELDQIAILDEGVEVGGTRYYSLTLNAQDWFEEWCRCWPDAPEMQLAGWLYAAAHSMEPDALLRTWNDKFKLAAHVWLWRCRCGIKRGQIAPLQRLLMPETPWPKDGRNPEDDRDGYGGFGWLTATLGPVDGDPDYWKNKAPFLKALQRYRDLSLYGDADPEIKKRRWETWRDSALAEEQVAIRRLKTAWKAFLELSGKAESKTPPMEELAAETVREAAKGGKPAKDAGAKFPPIPTEDQLKAMVMEKIRSRGGEG